MKYSTIQINKNNKKTTKINNKKSMKMKNKKNKITILLHLSMYLK